MSKWKVLTYNPTNEGFFREEGTERINKDKNVITHCGASTKKPKRYKGEGIMGIYLKIEGKVGSEKFSTCTPI